MSTDEFLAAVDTGYRTVPDDCDLLAVGEMGIANTTTAATLCAALLGGGAARWAGRGTGVDDDGLARKREAIEAALNFHRDILDDPLAAAAALGGRELAAIAGAVLAARRHHIPVLLDGFVATSAVLPLARLDRARARSLPRRARLGRIRPPRSAARTEAGSAARPGHAARRGVGRGRRDPAGARRAGLPCRNGDIRGGRRFRRGGLTKPCHISQRNWPEGSSSDEGAAHANGDHQG